MRVLSQNLLEISDFGSRILILPQKLSKIPAILFVHLKNNPKALKNFTFFLPKF